MKEITAILLILIAVIGIISIIIVKLYYKDKEKDLDKEKLEEFIESTKSDYDNEKRQRARRSSQRRANISEAQRYANTIEDVETENVGGTTALLRQRRKAMEEAPKRQVRRVRRAQVDPNQAPRKQVAPKKVPRTPERVKTQMNKEEEVKSFQEPIKPVHTATINSAKKAQSQPKPRQVPMTEKQKEFIANDSNKLVIEDSGETVKVVKSVKPADSLEEIKESAKIEEKDEIKTEDIVEKAESDTAKLVQQIEEAKEGVEEQLSETEEKAKETIQEEVADVKEETETVEEEIAKTEEEVKESVEKVVDTKEADTKDAEETSKIESTIAKIKQASDEKDKAEETVEKVEEETVAPLEAKVEEPTTEPEIEVEKPTTEPEIEVAKETTAPVETEAEKAATEPEIEVEKPTTEPETEVEESKSIISEGASKVSEKISEVADRVYNDDLHLILNKGAKEEEIDETPENEFVTINPDTETNPTSNELINNAIQSIRNFRKPNVPEKPVVVETKEDIVPDDYAQDLGDGIEYIGDTITITPIHEDEIPVARTQPNEDVDKIYKEINGESYNKTDDEDLSKSYEDVTDETSEKDANVYTDEDYEKIEKAEEEKKRRAENTKKILGSKGISEEELRRKTEAKTKSKRTRKAATAEDVPVEEGQKTLMVHKARNDVEEVYINGTLFELRVGQVVMFNIKGETYSSQILKLKPGYIGVRYRSKKIWVKSNTVKKILK